MSGNAALR